MKCKTLGPEPALAPLTSVGADSICLWIHKIKMGENWPLEQIWSLFHQRITNLGRAQLGPSSRRSFDEQDLAVETFQRFLNAVRAGRCDQNFFPSF